jgi:hypothetical protein
MHVYLQAEEADKLLKASGRLKISPTKLLHLLVQRLESIDIEEVVKIEFKSVSSEQPVKRANTIQRKNWVTDI